MTSQKYEIRNEMASGDKVALEIDWMGTLAVPFQTIPKGGQVRAHFAAFLEFKDGKIVPSATTIATSRSRPPPCAATPSIDAPDSPPLLSPPSHPRPQPRSSPDTFGHTTGLSLA
jgi:hypothetical protein